MDTVLAHYSEEPQRCADLEPAHRYNNYVKACLIQDYMRQGGHVLDLGCGKGGDLKKFRENRAGSYVGLDAVPEQIRKAEERHRNAKCMFAAVFEVGDFTEVSINAGNRGGMADAASQFRMFAASLQWDMMKILKFERNGSKVLTDYRMASADTQIIISAKLEKESNPEYICDIKRQAEGDKHCLTTEFIDNRCLISPTRMPPA